MIKRRNYTFALTQDNERIQRIVKQYPKYAYICHDKDDAEVHYHYYVEFLNPRSISALAKELNIPENMIEQVYSKKGILTYLTHDNANDKHHYDKSEIISNFDLKTEVEEDQYKTSKEDYYLIANTIHDYYAGKITFSQLVAVMEPIFRQYNSARVYDLIIKTMNRNVWACHTFRVPCSTTSKNGTKKGGNMT